MSDISTKWILNLVDRATAPLKSVASKIKKAAKQAENFGDKFDKIALKAVAFQQVSQSFQQLGDDLNQAVAPGIAFNSSMKDLQAITGSTQKQMDLMGRNARNLAKTFGGEAAGGVEVYKLLLSQLGPALADTPEILNSMAEGVFHLSKTMGGDTKGAVEVLTTAMNQYGVDLNDPIAAQASLNQFMNAMSAGAKEGSAELPALKAAIQNAGGVAKTANLSFEEMVASLELLDKGGKKGAEGGIALRNVLSKLERGRFLPKDTQIELQAAGVNINRLSDKSLKFTDRLRELKKIQHDSALVAKLFGDENQLAGIKLIEYIDEIDAMTVKITDTNTTTEQSGIIMSSYAETMSRVQAKIKDIGISLFNTIEGFLPFIQGTIQTITVLSRLAGAVEGVKLLFEGLEKPLKTVQTAFKMARRSAFRFGKTVALTGFKALKASGKYVLAALQGLGSFAVGLISATAAQMGLNVAMTANPIGLIIVGIGLAIAAVAALIKWWDQIKAAIVKFGKWILKNNPFSWLINIVDKIFPGFKQAFYDFFNGIWDWITGWADRLWEKMKAAWNGIKSLFGFGDDEEATITVNGDGEVTTDPAPEETEESFQQKMEREGALGANNTEDVFANNSPTSAYSAPTSDAGGGSGKSITMNLEITNNFTLAENLEHRIHEIKEQITEMIVDSGRDSIIMMGT